MSAATTDLRPKQERAKKTEQALLDALVRLLATKSFADLTVSELAREADLTTGAIYRRFADKNDVLRAAFHRFVERTKLHDKEYSADLSDREILERYITELMEFTLKNISLMRAANILNDMSAFDQMTEARSISASWLASRLKSSTLPGEELNRRCQFMLRIATATYRDTFLSGRGAAAFSEARGQSRQNAALIDDLIDLAFGYLGLAH